MSNTDKFKNKRKAVVGDLKKEDVNIKALYNPDEIIYIQVNEIAQSPDQSREIELDSKDIKELADNIKEVGLAQPIVVRENLDANNTFKWILVCGERRLAAHTLLNLTSIKAIIRNDLNEDEIKAWALTLSENVMRKSLKPAEQFNAIEIGKQKFKLKNKDMAEKLGLSETRIIQIHGTSKLPKDLLQYLEEENKLSSRHVSAFKLLLGNSIISTLSPADTDNDYVKKIKENLGLLKNDVIEGGLSGKEAIDRAKEIKDPRKEKSFLSLLSERLRHTIIFRKPKKMSEHKRVLSIEQAKSMIDLLQGFISEEEKKLKKQEMQ